MLNKIKSLLSRHQGHDSLRTPEAEKAKFILKYNELKIGFLNIENSIWTFVYSDDFKKQDYITCLVDFPDVNKNLALSPYGHSFQYGFPVWLNQLYRKFFGMRKWIRKTPLNY